MKPPAAGAAAVAGAAAPLTAQPRTVRTTTESSARAMDSREARPAQLVVPPAHSVRRGLSVVHSALSVGRMGAFAASVRATESRAEPVPVVRQAVAAVPARLAERVALVRTVAATELRQAAGQRLVRALVF